MSSGDLNTYGGKKNNFPFQHNLLLINGAIQAATAAGATESTLQLVLTALQNGQDYEAKLVRDSDVPSVTWLEVRIFNQTTGIFDPPVYYLAGSNTVGSPVMPVVYIDPTTLLATIASNTTGLATPITGLATSLTRVTGAGAASVAAGKRSISFFNAGDADGNVNGSVIKAGESITYPELSSRDTYTAISYDALTTELVITTIG